jgi:hypothetical protein
VPPSPATQTLSGDWAVSGQNVDFVVTSISLTTADNSSSATPGPEPLILITAYVTFNPGSNSVSMGYTFFDEGAHVQLGEDSDLESGNRAPPQGIKSKIVFALWDSPHSSRISITLQGFFWSGPLTLHDVPVPAGT